MKSTRICAWITGMAAVLTMGAAAACAQTTSSASAGSSQAAPPAAKSVPIDPVTRSPIAGSAPLLPKPIFPTADREVSKFTVQYVYNFARYRYTPAVQVEPVNRGTATNDTPEAACIAFLSSMSALDYDWWLSNWDPESRKRLEADNQAHHQDAAFWHKLWQRAVAGRRITIEQRLESGPYVLMIYRIDNPANPSETFSSALPFRLFHNQWMATEELASDNLSLYAAEGRSSVEESRVLSPIASYDPAVFDSAKGQADFFMQYPKGKESVTTVVR